MTEEDQKKFNEKVFKFEMTGLELNSLINTIAEAPAKYAMSWILKIDGIINAQNKKTTGIIK